MNKKYKMKKVILIRKNFKLISRQYYQTLTYAVELRKLNYRTGYFGKYLNEYEGKGVPPGISLIYSSPYH